MTSNQREWAFTININPLTYVRIGKERRRWGQHINVHQEIYLKTFLDIIPQQFEQQPPKVVYYFELTEKKNVHMHGTILFDDILYPSSCLLTELKCCRDIFCERLQSNMKDNIRERVITIKPVYSCNWDSYIKKDQGELLIRDIPNCLDMIDTISEDLPMPTKKLF